MASFINTNMVSLNTQNNLSKSQDALAQSIKRLSTGLRINSSKDDAAGLAISNRMDSTIRGQTVAIRNTNDAVSFSQTADGALAQINNNLQRLRELAVQAANGTNSAGDRELLNTEFNQLQQEVIRIKNNTAFNGTNAMQENSVTVQIGAGTTQYDKVKINGIDLTHVTEATTTDLSVSNAFTKDQFDKAKASLAKTDPDRVNNIFFSEATGHVYERVLIGKTYEVAQSDAAASSFGGHQGYLATISNADENLYVKGKGNNELSWINGSNGVITGDTAPESGALPFVNLDLGTGPDSVDFGHSINGDGVWINTDKDQHLYSMVEYGGRSSTRLNSESLITTIGTGETTRGAYTVNTGAVVTVPENNTLILDSNGAAYGEGVKLTAGQLFYIQTTGEAGVPGVNGGRDTYGDNASFDNPITEGATKLTSDVQKALSPGLAVFGNASGVNILTQGDALSAIDSLDKAMLQVNVAQIQQGATQNRLTAIISTLTSNNESTINARSHIMDTDFAAETASMARAQILQQAGMAMLAQANTSNNGIMALMR